MLIKKPEDYTFYQYRTVNDKVVEYKRLVVYRFGVSADVLAESAKAIEIIAKWATSPEGKWLIENAAEPLHYDSFNRVEIWTIEYAIIATLESKKLTEYYLRFS